MSAWPPLAESDSEVGGDLLPFAYEEVIHRLQHGTKKDNLLSFMPVLSPMDELVFYTS